MPRTSPTISCDPNPVTVDDLAQVMAQGCDDDRYYNLDAFTAAGQDVFAMGRPVAGQFGPAYWWPQSAGLVRFELRSVRLGRDGYPASQWHTDAILDVEVV